jgi:ankyrin repeat protein
MAATVGVTGTKRRGPLQLASAKGNAEFCRFLIKTACDVDATDSDGSTVQYHEAVNRLGDIQRG